MAAENNRILAVDAVRGWALMGLFLLHMIEYYELYWADPYPDPVHDWMFAVFAGKSFSLLALCFGFSFQAMLASAERRGERFDGRFAWRLLVLFAIGWLHGTVYRGDIITTLAALGLLLIPLNRIRDNRVLGAIALVLFLLPYPLFRMIAAMQGAEWALANLHFYTDPAMPVLLNGSLGEVLATNSWTGQHIKWWYYLETGRVTQILGLFIIGLVLGRIGFFQDLDRFARERRIALALAIGAAALAYAGRQLLAPDMLPQAREGGNMALSSIQDLALTFVTLLLLLAAWQGPARALLRHFAPVGRMTLTFYVGASLVFVPIFYGFGLKLHDDLSQTGALLLGLAAFVAQIVIARLWLSRFAYGPFEWLWRSLTYPGRQVPLRLSEKRLAPG